MRKLELWWTGLKQISKMCLPLVPYSPFEGKYASLMKKKNIRNWVCHTFMPVAEQIPAPDSCLCNLPMISPQPCSQNLDTLLLFLPTGTLYQVGTNIFWWHFGICKVSLLPQELSIFLSALSDVALSENHTVILVSFQQRPLLVRWAGRTSKPFGHVLNRQLVLTIG